MTAEPYSSSGFGETMWASLKSVPIDGRAEEERSGQGLQLLSLCQTDGL